MGTLRTHPHVPAPLFRSWMDKGGLTEMEIMTLFRVSIERIENWRSGADKVPSYWWWIGPALCNHDCKRYWIQLVEEAVAIGDSYRPEWFTWGNIELMGTPDESTD